MKFGIHNIFVKDDDMGEMSTGESFVKRDAAARRANDLKKTFKNVEVRPGTLETGHGTTPAMKKHLKDD